MAPTKKKNKKKSKAPRLLSHTRPKSLSTTRCQAKPTSLSSKATRTQIRAYHNLQKRLSTAIAAGDTTSVEAIQRQLEEQGGLEAYQHASIIGQSGQRGGDSSKVLMQWLSTETVDGQKIVHDDTKKAKLRMLEVGTLKTTNACSRSGVFDVTRIDLHSQSDEILQQDFMERPLPQSEADKFDVVSLSLVLNFVPDPTARGEMLRRTCSFLRTSSPTQAVGDDGAIRCFPALFLVIPAPCLTNSRYTTEGSFEEIMESLGYIIIFRKMSSKLAYFLFHYHDSESNDHRVFKKTEINPGKARNNFAIVVQ
ncbi:MAG: hypothetical protein M1817_006598 [Caeruleum heppii]|nr:MAG: hypothetical protein M1817_006598 [Caeruleum heppii]